MAVTCCTNLLSYRRLENFVILALYDFNKKGLLAVIAFMLLTEVLADPLNLKCRFCFS